jgi:hypothetical protein
MRHNSLLLFTVLLLVTGCHSQGTGGTLASAWVPFEDQAEHVFKLKVPKGWKITGGFYRYGPLDPRSMVDMVSPDGKVDLRLGDYRVPPYTELSATMKQLGWHEGHPYSPNNAAQQIVASYRPGWVFADLYGQSRFSGQCKNLKLKAMNKTAVVHPNPDPHTTVTAGEVYYTCDGPDGPMVAYVFAETSMFKMNGISNWMATWLYSFSAPQDKGAAAMKTILHSLSTIEVSPAWEQKQLQIEGNFTQAVMTKFNHDMASQRAHYEHMTAQMQSQEESFDRVIRGVDLTTDSVDGTQREVWTGTGQSHWMNGLGQVVDSPTQPNGYHKLNTQP